MDMTKLVLIAHSRQSLASELQYLLDISRLIDPDLFCSSQDAVGEEALYIYLPSILDTDGMTADEGEAQRIFQRAALSGGRQFILLSSALIYGIGPGRQPLVTENYSYPGQDSNRIASRWRSLELLATTYLNGKMPLTILRPCSLLGSETFPAQRFSRRVITTLPGHDPVFQFLRVADLAGAIRCVLEQSVSGSFNVAPDTVVPLRKAVQAAKRARLAFPRTLQRILRPAEQLEYLRYSWTISGEKLQRELGFTPRLSSLAALTLNAQEQFAGEEMEFDPFGMDKDYIRFFARTLFKFLSDFYWRVEDKGIEHIPASGPAVLVGVHRGFMPLDGVMALHTVAKHTGRYPRFLTHPALLKFPFLFNFMTKLGGVVACQESADRILKSNQLLGIFPEGIHGAFCYYRDAYKLHAFGRDAFVKLALRHRAPIIPFVTLGSAEIFPVFAKIKSRRWTRYTDWPCIPITPTFPLLPLPLPSKWHTQFLEPISTQSYSSGAAEDHKVVSEISHEVRKRMQAALTEMRSRRRSIFFGSIFGETHDESRSSPLSVQE